MPSTSKQQAKTMTAACKNAEFRKKVDIPKKVACDFHNADRGKYHEDIDRIKELAGIDDFGDENDNILIALEMAYDFISSPQRMETRKTGPTILTYHTHKYNELTAKLRDAIAGLRKKQ